MIKAGCTLSGLLLIAAVRAQAAADWSYAGETGPDSWGGLDSAYETCSAGHMQSPIELGEANAVADIPVSVDYLPGPLTLQSNGKTVQLDFPAGSDMTSSGRVFPLVQVHFHAPSEHTLDGETYPLAAHFVHATTDGTLAVLGVLFEQGEPHPELQKVIDAARSAGADAQTVDGVTLNARDLVPADLDVFRYMGSLTTPPCSEGVNWHVAEAALTASGSQLRALQALMGENARPVQPVNERLVVAPE